MYRVKLVWICSVLKRIGKIWQAAGDGDCFFHGFHFFGGHDGVLVHIDVAEFMEAWNMEKPVDGRNIQHFCRAYYQTGCEMTGWKD